MMKLWDQFMTPIIRKINKKPKKNKILTIMQMNMTPTNNKTQELLDKKNSKWAKKKSQMN